MTEPLTGEEDKTEASVSAKAALAEPAPLGGGARVETAPARAMSVKRLTSLLHDLVFALIICVALITFVVQAFRVQGMSMAPELLDGERILVNKFIYHFRPIQRGDVVVFWYPDDPDVSFIKRVIALPRERVEIIRGRVLVDGKTLREPYVKGENADHRTYPPREVRPGHYFVMGDNRRGSNDSRAWGLVPRRYIYGKAFLRIWPPSELGLIE